MKGAIIADLAAWACEHQADEFYAHLVMPDAQLSVCSDLLLNFI